MAGIETGVNQISVNSDVVGVQKSRTDGEARIRIVENIKDSDKPELSAKDVDAAIEILNRELQKIPTSLQFSVDGSSKRLVVQVTNNDTGEVVMKLPGDAVLRVAQNLESLKGVIFDDVF
ncbi:flagellar protein FlaG [Porticoccaceae bacterium]|nr:flagellar protein FlaG [Porticoccaceae bacterium]